MIIAGRIRMLSLALLAAALMSTQAWACPICFSGKTVAPGQRIDAADLVVLAEPGTTPGTYRVAQAIKGDVPAGEVIPDVAAGQVVPATSGDVELLVRNKSSHRWMSLGSTRAAEAGWLRQFAETAPVAGSAGWTWPGAPLPSSEADKPAWAARLALVAPLLESPDRLSAAIAFGELARAPYAAARSLEGALDPRTVASWLDHSPPERRSAYLLLLGIVGGPPEEENIGATLTSLAQAGEATDLAAIVAADLELGGPSRLPWIEEAYLGKTPRSLAEIEAVLVALGVQGTADAAIPRADIVAAYRRFVQVHAAMAGFVATDLGDWRDFSAAKDMEAALRSGAIKDPGSQFAVLSYLKEAPSAADAASSQGSN